MENLDKCLQSQYRMDIFKILIQDLGSCKLCENLLKVPLDAQIKSYIAQICLNKVGRFRQHMKKPHLLLKFGINVSIIK